MQDCGSVFHQEVCVSGEVTITPDMECGPVEVQCLKAAIIPKAPRGGQKRRCSFAVYQRLLVAVPVTFTAHSHCRLDQIACRSAHQGPCREAP